MVRWTRCIGRSIIGMAIGGLAAAAVLVVAPGTAAGAPCDGLGCVPHLRTGAVEGASCAPTRQYPFGVDAAGNTYTCLATFLHPRENTWTPAPPLVGVRDFGALCTDEQGSAQSPLGIPMLCRDSTWQQFVVGIPEG